MLILFSYHTDKFDFYEIRAASPVWGPFILFFFALTVNFVLINFFLTIMMEGFTQVKEDISKQANDYEIVDFMIDRFKTFTGMGENKKKKRRAAMRQPAQESADYVEGERDATVLSVYRGFRFYIYGTVNAAVTCDAISGISGLGPPQTRVKKQETRNKTV